MRAKEFVDEMTGRRGFMKGATAASITPKNLITKIVTDFAKTVPSNKINLLDQLLEITNARTLQKIFRGQLEGETAESFTDEEQQALEDKLGEDWEFELGELCVEHDKDFTDMAEEITGRKFLFNKVRNVLKNNGIDDTMSFIEYDSRKLLNAIRKAASEVKNSKITQQEYISGINQSNFTGDLRIVTGLLTRILKGKLPIKPPSLPSKQNSLALPAPDNKDLMEPVKIEKDKDKSKI